MTRSAEADGLQVGDVGAEEFLGLLAPDGRGEGLVLPFAAGGPLAFLRVEVLPPRAPFRGGRAGESGPRGRRPGRVCRRASTVEKS